MKLKRNSIAYTGIGICLVLVFCLSIGIKNKYFSVFAKDNRKLPIYCVDTKEKKVAISFDVNWGKDNSQKILETLDKYNAKATFFVMGCWVDKYPDKLKLLHEKGHEIGNHSNLHPDMTKISKDKVVQEIAVTDAKIMGVTGEKTTLFRFPSGAYSNESIEAAESTHHKCIQWDVDSVDWKEKGLDIEYNRVIKKAKPGSIILFHNDAKFTPENLPRILEKLKNEGYKFVKVSDLIYKDEYYIDSTGKQIKNND